MFKTRLLSSIVLVIIIAACLILGGPVLFCFTLFLAIKAFWELSRATKVRNEGYKINMMQLIGILGIVGYYGLLYQGSFGLQAYIMFPITLTLVAMLFVYVFTFPRYHANQVLACFFSFIYAPIMLGYLYLTRCLEGGFYIVWLIFISSWICDTSAYLVGSMIGKHKMAPILSPKKSVEGAIGGVAGSVLVGFLYALLIVQERAELANMMWVFPLICGIGAMISMVGDLAASAIKRNFDIKDYGRLIPGHGGVMDRFDSVVFTAPMIYYLAVLLLG